MKDAVDATFADPVLQKRLAKYLVQQCFRNSVLEDLHAGIAPSSEAGDFSDVVVCSPFGEIPWRRLSRFDDAEMKVLIHRSPHPIAPLPSSRAEDVRGRDLRLRS